MSSDTAAASASSSGDPKPKSVQWLDTYLFSVPCDLVALSVGLYINQGRFKMNHQDDVFNFKVAKTGIFEITVSINREASKTLPPEEGYLLRFSCTALGVKTPTKTVDLRYNETFASVVFSLEGFIEKMIQMKTRDYIWHFKIIAYFVEFTSLQNEKYQLYERLAQKIKPRFCKSARQRKEMCSILKCPDLNDLFTGRQDFRFVAVKLNLIARTATYSKEIAQFMKMHEEGNVQPPLPNFRVILNRIMFDSEGPIQYKDVLVVYLTGYTFGLTYLRVMASYCMEENLMDFEYLVEVLKATTRLDDFRLFNKAADIFLENRAAVMNTENWKELKNNVPLASSVLHAITYRLRVDELYIPPGFGTSTKE